MNLLFIFLQERSCHSDSFKCPKSKRCVYKKNVCDGYDSCGDSSDEDELMCKVRIHSVSNYENLIHILYFIFKTIIVFCRIRMTIRSYINVSLSIWCTL